MRRDIDLHRLSYTTHALVTWVDWTQLNPALVVVDVPYCSCRVADRSGETDAGARIVEPATLKSFPTGTLEYNQEKGPEGGYAGRVYYNVAFIALGCLVSLACKPAIPTYAFHIQRVTVMTENCQ